MVDRVPPAQLVRYITKQLHHQTNLSSSRVEKRSHATSAPSTAKKPRKGSPPRWENPIRHPMYSASDVDHVEQTHREPRTMAEQAAHVAVRLLRRGFDFVSQYKGAGGGMTRQDWLNRCIFLETIAGVPGIVAGMIRHLRSLRNMERDRGWIHTHMEEAENERMHLLIFMAMKDPGLLLRFLVKGGQGVFFTLFFASYVASPTTCHRFVGYMEEEAIHTYTTMIQDIEGGSVRSWKDEPAPVIARDYYHLANDATVLDMIKCIRADETQHRDVNHTLADLDWHNDANPFPPWPKDK